MVSPVSAVAAYKKVLQANNKIINDGKSDGFKSSGVLRVGDDFTGVGKVKKASFGDILQKEFVENPIKNISDSEKTIFDITKTDSTKDLSPNLVELVEAVDKAQMTLNTMVTIRDKILGAYQEIIKMPL